MSEFKHDILFRVQVTVNGKQDYTIHTSCYDDLCDKLTDIYIKESE